MTSAPDSRSGDPHGDQPVRTAGAPLEGARAAMVMIHGRGGMAESILSIVPLLESTDVAFLAPQAANGTWYPFGFMSPIDRNEPGISSGIRKIGSVLETVATGGIPPERTILLGFSQGACLATEFAARNARRYGGVAGLSGGLIGPDDSPRDYSGSLAGTPVFLGCSDVDPHIPERRVRETADVLGRLGAQVDMRIYPGMGHIIGPDEIDAVRAMMAAITT
jgi:predicted esterase